MASLANGIDFLSQIVTQSEDKSSIVSYGSGKTVLVFVYALASAFLLGMQEFSRVPGLPDFSFVYFLGATLQFLSFFSLCVKVQSTHSVQGISSGSVVMTGTSLAFRVFATTMCEGYLPSDHTGDFMLQVVDAGTLLLAIFMLYSIHKTYVHTYQEENDELSIQWILPACIVMACVLHADLNHCMIYDTLWACSLNIEIFQTLPQLYMISKVGGLVDAMTAHYVVLTFFAAVCRFSFWVWAVPGCVELSMPNKYHWNLQMSAYYILGGYLLEMLVHMDFMYFYLKAWYQGDKKVYLPSHHEI